MTTFETRAKRHTMTRLAGALLLGAALVGAPVSAYAQGETAPETDAASAERTLDSVVATVGDQTITERDLALAAEDLGQQLQQVPPQQQRAFLVNVLVDMKVMAAAARAAGVDQSEAYKARVSFLEEKALRRAFFTDQIMPTVTPEVVDAAYQAFVAGFEPEEEVRARHILVETREEADAVQAELAGGKPFEVVAMEKTIDPSGKNSGGDLGYFGRGMMVPEFETAAFALEAGQVSEPVQSQFGWHIIKLEEKRMSAPPPLQQVQQQLSQQAIFDAYDAAIAGQKAAMPVVIPDETLAAQVAAQNAETE